MTDLNELAARVEAGESLLNPTIAEVALDLSYDEAWRWEQANGRPLDSLDAAKALHDAVLTGWRLVALWESEKAKDRPWWGAKLGRDEPYKVMPSVVGVSSPAAAWVTAILRAKAANP